MEGVPALRAGVNPATWMLEVSTLNKEHELGVDFAQIYRASALFRCAARPSHSAATPLWLPSAGLPVVMFRRATLAVAAPDSTACGSMLASEVLDSCSAHGV